MKIVFKQSAGVILAASGMVALLGGCGPVQFTHAPPGTAVNLALAKKAEAVPTPTPMPLAANAEMASGRETTTETVADYFTLGNLMMDQEKYGEAIKAYENAVRLDPTFSDAWNHLAICYQNTGQGVKAMEAFKKYKTTTGQ